jgi:hypothetical protein
MNLITKEKIWNAFSIFFYAFLVFVAGYFYHRSGRSLDDITIWKWFIMVMATYRLTRILVYDRIFKFFRDFTKATSTKAFFIAMKNLITCPWCAGVWAALLVFVLEMFVPYGIYLNYLLAMAGAGSFFLVITNLVGLAAENKQMEVRKTRRFDI